MIKDLGLNLKSLYLFKPFEQSALSQILVSKNPHLTRRLSYIVHDIKEVSHLLELDGGEAIGLRLSCKVKTECAWVGKAKDQIEPLSFMRNELNKQPKYNIIANLRSINTNESLFDFQHETRDPVVVLQTYKELKKHLSHIL